jgi:hypothetical protein
VIGKTGLPYFFSTSDMLVDRTLMKLGKVRKVIKELFGKPGYENAGHHLDMKKQDLELKTLVPSIRCQKVSASLVFSASIFPRSAAFSARSVQLVAGRFGLRRCYSAFRRNQHGYLGRRREATKNPLCRCGMRVLSRNDTR